MGYKFRRKESVQQNVRRIADEQVRRAIDEIGDSSLDRDEVVHQVRKRCKKLRGLLRLVRESFDDYSDENACFRDLARQLSAVRDSETIVECYDGLIQFYRDQLDSDYFDAVRQLLTDRCAAVTEQPTDLEQTLGEVEFGLKESRFRIKRWQLTGKGFSAIKKGLHKTYQHGLQAFEVAYHQRSNEAFHEWRKRVKYHWYQVRLLQSIGCEEFKSRRITASTLATLLGDDHDLAVLGQRLAQLPDDRLSPADRQVLLALIDCRQSALRDKAKVLGEEIFAKRAKKFVAKIKSAWG